MEKKLLCESFAFDAKGLLSALCCCRKPVCPTFPTGVRLSQQQRGCGLAEKPHDLDTFCVGSGDGSGGCWSQNARKKIRLFRNYDNCDIFLKLFVIYVFTNHLGCGTIYLVKTGGERRRAFSERRTSFFCAGHKASTNPFFGRVPSPLGKRAPPEGKFAKQNFRRKTPMKKVLALVLAVVLCMGMSAVAFAATDAGVPSTAGTAKIVFNV
ncbi:MAG: hypothetical protein PHD67_04265, partial [Oscillospiraceae bacterium]|nr:hypothetical protein [Oscillospiraceae bacterium]